MSGITLAEAIERYENSGGFADSIPDDVIEPLLVIAQSRMDLAAIDEMRKIRDEIVPDLRDFKWLDPECHGGCQSLKWKAEVERLRAELRPFAVA